MSWTAEAVEARLEEAAETLRRLPPTHTRPRLTAWPDVVRGPSEGYGYQPPRLRLGPPSAGAISRLDEVLSWLPALDPADRRLLWARARRLPWRRIQAEDGRSVPTLRQAWRRALVRLAAAADRKSGRGLRAD